MLKYYFIFLFTVSICNAKFLHPEEGGLLHYTYVNFQWEQQPNITSYRFQIFGEDTDMILDTIINKTLFIDYHNLDWNNSYVAMLSIGSNNFENIDWADTVIFNIGEKLPSSSINVEFIDDQLFQDGLMFFSQVSPSLAMVAIDKNGNQVWNSDFAYINHWSKHGQLFGMKNGRGVETNFYNQIIWMTPEGTEIDAHEIKQIPNNNYMGITTEYQLGPIPLGPWTETYQDLGYIADGDTNEFVWRGTQITEWDNQTNMEVWNWNPFEYFDMADFDSIEGRWWSPINGSHYGMIFDWNHTNAFHFDESENMIYVSNRNLSRISKISYPSKDLVWSLGPPSIYGYGDDNICTDLLFSCQHHIQMLENGDLLFFDNGKLSELFLSDPYPTTRIRRIRVLEDLTCETIWQYDLPQELYGHSWGSAQLLENGHYFLYTHGSGYENGSICTLMEISPDQNLVWKASHQIPYAVWYRGYKIPSIHPSAFSVYFDRYRKFDFNSVNINGILLDDNNRSLNFTIHNGGGYTQPYSYVFSDSSGWFLNMADTIVLGAGDQHTVYISPELINDSLNNNITLSVKPLYHKWAKKDFKYNIYYLNGVLTNQKGTFSPKDFKLYQNFPNPFNVQTTIGYSIPKDSRVDIMIYNANGNLVKNIFNDFQNSGKHFINWDGTDNSGILMSSGVYYYKINTPYFHQEKKMILLK